VFKPGRFVLPFLLSVITIASVGGAALGASPPHRNGEHKPQPRTVATATVYAWGDNASGQLGNNSTVSSLTPVQVVGPNGSGTLSGIIAIAAGNDAYGSSEWSGGGFSLALSSDGTVWAWGENEYGQLGNNSTTNGLVPVQVAGPTGSGALTGITAITTGFGFSLALASDGTVWTWGNNSTGQLGNNSTTDSSIPVQVVGSNGTGALSGIIAIAAGTDYTSSWGGFGMALASDGTVWAWGANGFGELGDNSTAYSSVPVQVLGSAGSGNIAISAGYGFSAVLASNGEIWAAGENFGGNLGHAPDTDGDFVSNDQWCNPIPHQVAGANGSGTLSGITSIAAGGGNSFCLALASNGTVWAWGTNNSGYLGHAPGTEGDYQSYGQWIDPWPNQVVGSNGTGALAGITAIAASGGDIYGGSSLALDSNGAVWAWGTNSNGQLGNGSTTDSSTPVQVVGPGGAGALSGVTAIAAGGGFSLALLPETPTVSGAVTLQGSVNEAQSITFQIQSTADLSSITTQTVTLSTSGAYTLSVPAGTYNIAAKGSSWLEAVVLNVNATSSVSGVDFTLIPGDLNGDNQISLADLLLLLKAYGSTPNSSNWNPAADLNCDGQVSLTDLLLLLKNYGDVGQTLPSS
jgi:alpha-tubulin suppressor-like RCC1 family protein